MFMFILIFNSLFAFVGVFKLSSGQAFCATTQNRTRHVPFEIEVEIEIAVPCEREEIESVMSV